MKIITNITRLLVGLLFIFSGFIKLNDPKGFSYKLEEYFTVFAEDLSTEQDTFTFSASYGDQQLTTSKVLLKTETSKSFQLSSAGWSPVYAIDSASGDSQLLAQRTEVYVMNGDASIGTLEIVVTDSTSSPISIVYGAGDFIKKESINVQLSETVNYSEEINVSSLIRADSWLVGFFNSLKPFATAIGIFVCVLEVVLGWALLIGWQSGLILWLLFLLIVFFTFLTGYSAFFNKVTDCGCFGNAIPLTPWESFYKDIILSVLILILIAGRKYIKPLYSTSFSVRFLTSMAVIFTGFSIYCMEFLPVFNFLEYKKGADIAKKMEIPEGERVSPHKVMEYIYNDGTKDITVIYDTDKNTFEPAINGSWTFVRVGDETIIEEAYEPPIHDFHLYQSDRSTDDLGLFLEQEGYKLLLVMHQFKDARSSAMEDVRKLATAAEENNVPFWALTASSAEEAEAFRHEHQLPFDFHFGDDTNLKSIIRSNPGLLLLKDNTVIEDWSSRRLPEFADLQKLIQ